MRIYSGFLTKFKYKSLISFVTKFKDKSLISTRFIHIYNIFFVLFFNVLLLNDSIMKLLDKNTVRIMSKFH
jgi:hypothetical protein